MNHLKKSGLILLLSLATTLALAQKHNLNIVFIGNSITQGGQMHDPATEAPPATAAAYLREQKHIGTVEFSNQGRSGFTTVDFLPGGNTFAKVEEAANAFTDKDALLIFSIKLGTNDSAIQGPNGSPVSPDDYQKNLKAITGKLLTDFPKAIIIFQYPIWYSPNTYNSAKYLQEGLSRLESYIPKIDGLAAGYKDNQPKRVFVGDKKAWDYFKKNYLTDMNHENGREGIFYLHPNKKGSEALGQFWGKAIMRCIKQI